MCREREEWSFGRSRRRGERLGRAQDEPKSALEADKVETPKNYQGKVKSPALQNRRQGTQIRPWATTVPPACGQTKKVFRRRGSSYRTSGGLLFAGGIRWFRRPADRRPHPCSRKAAAALYPPLAPCQCETREAQQLRQLSRGG